jgi:hypothetical protein
MKCRTIFALVAVALFGVFGRSVAQDGSRNPSPSAPSPSAFATIPTQAQIDDIWSKLVLLSGKHGGYVSHQDFEATFDMRFEKNVPFRSRGYWHTAYQGKSWILGAVLWDGFYDEEGRPASTVTVKFRDEVSGVAVHNPCLSPGKVFGDLRQNGWQGDYDLNRRLEGHVESTNTLFRMSPSGKYIVRVLSNPNCVLDVTVGESGALSGR